MGYKKQKKGIMAKIWAVTFSLMTVFTVSFPATASASLCDEMAKGTKGFLSCGTTTTTFTDFNGQLNTPDASQYSPALSQNKDLREFIKNVVNFALGFLGLIAVVVIIYGGFLYVTAAVNEEQTAKGKKAITYAIIGILIILSSYAIVNTILKAGTGSDASPTNGSAPTGTSYDQNSQRRAIFAYAGSVVQTIAHDFVTAYQNYKEIETDLVTLQNTDVFQQVINASDFKSNLQQKRSILQNIISKAGALSQVAEVGQHGLTVIDGYVNASNKSLDTQSTKDVNGGKVMQFFGMTDYNNLKNDFEAQFGTKGSLTDANKKDFAQAILKADNQLSKLQDRLKQAAALPEVDTQFDVVHTQLISNISGLPSDQSQIAVSVSASFAQGSSVTVGKDVNNAMVLQIVNDLSALYDMVKDLQFVYTIITTDKVEGNAPLPVNFNALKSLDPNNHTIPDQNYHWNFGDLSNSANNTAVGPVASYIYKAPGTYIVQLTIDAPDADKTKGEQQPASGIAYQTIVVKPSVAQVSLQSKITGQTDPYFLSKYENGKQTVDIQDLPVTLSEAKAGITFDASATMVGAKGDIPLNSPQLQNSQALIQWNFGDTSNSSNNIKGPPDSKSTITGVKYNKEGVYRVTLEVTDDRGVTDRKIFNVIVNSLVARVRSLTGQKGKIGDQFSFQSLSASDNGTLKSYSWNIINAKTGKPPEDFVDSKTDELKYIFKTPGVYTLSHTVDNGSTTAELSTPLSLNIDSKPPVARFNFTNTDPAQPNVFIFDGTGSYDPDATADQVMQYKWEFNAFPGECSYFTLKEDNSGYNSTAKDCTQLGTEGDKGYSASNGRIKVKFSKKGKYTTTLSVQNDSVQAQNSISQEQEFAVDNTLDVGWADDGKPISAQLTAGTTEVTFNVASENGVACDVVTGDGGKESGVIINGTAVLKHMYTKPGSYKVKLTVYDADDNGNAIYRKVIIAESDTPLAAITVLKNGELVVDPTSGIQGDRTTLFTFDASKSLNKGNGRDLNYSWDFGDGSDLNAKKVVTHTFKDIADQPSKTFVVKLVASDANPPGKKSQPDIVNITVRRLPPVINGLTAVPVGSSSTTPVQVNLTALGARDPDGNIVTYKWGYYDVNDPQTLLGVQITQSPKVTLTIGTQGVEGQKKTYKFAVLAKDNENDTFDSTKDMYDSLIPSVDVVNGPNKAPTSSFSADKTVVNICTTPGNPRQCDVINLTSSSKDPDNDGKIVSYMWDFGQGFTDPGDTNFDSPSVAFIATKPGEYKVRLKVRDNNGAEAVSYPSITLTGESTAAAPTAAFTAKQTDGKKVQFTNNSKADTKNGASLATYAWDFDIATDANGDGNASNDIQSSEANPVFEYKDYGSYNAKLTVTDNQGMDSSVTNKVVTNAPKPTPTPAPNPVPPKTQQQTQAIPLIARILSIPQTSPDGRVHLQGNSQDVSLDYSRSSGNITQFSVDKNIYYDTDGDRNPANDPDHTNTKPGTWKTTFLRSYGNATVRVTITDASGNKKSVDLDVVFDPLPTSNGGTGANNQLSAFALAGYEVVDWPLLLVSGTGFGIFTVEAYLRKKKTSKMGSKK